MLNLIRIIMLAIVLVIVLAFCAGIIADLTADWNEMPVGMRAVNIASLLTVIFIALWFIYICKVV